MEALPVPAMISRIFVTVAVAVALGGEPAFSRTPHVPEIRISDVRLFYRLYDAAAGTPSGAVLQRYYIEGGTDGVRQFVADRIVSGDALANNIAAKRTLYDNARTCAAKLPDVRGRLTTVLARLGTLLPDARFPPVTILIGRGNSGGMTGKAGVLIGLESICGADWLEPALDDRLVHLIAHEYVHIQQPMVQRDEPNVRHTVLESSLTEGVAEFVGELISGSVSNTQLQRRAAGRDAEFAPAFIRDMDSTDLSLWLYNGVGTQDKPGDLGYWVGYRIARQYYERSADKAGAVRRLVRMDDPKAILAASGWGLESP